MTKLHWQFRSVALMLGFIVIPLYYWLTFPDQHIGTLSDDAVYLLLAEVYSPWKSMSLPVYDYLRSISQFPPLFPLLLGLLGIDSVNSVYASLINVLFWIAGLAVTAYWLRLQSPQVALPAVIVGLFAFMPGSMLLSQELWSEFLYLLLSIAALSIASRGQRSYQHWLLAALLVSLATLTRSIGVTLMVAFVVVQLRSNWPRKTWPIALSVMPFLSWMLYRSIADQPIYVSELQGQFQQLNPSQWWRLAIEALNNLWLGLRWLLFPGFSALYPPWWLSLVQSLLVGAALTGWILRLRQWRFDAIYLLFYLLLLLVWPYNSSYFMSRFLFPVMPVILYYSYLALQALAGGVRLRRAHLPLAACLLLLLAMAPSIAYILERNAAGRDAEYTGFTRHRTWYNRQDLSTAHKDTRYQMVLFAALRRIPEIIPAGECMVSVFPPLTMLYSRRIVRPLPGAESSDVEFESALKACRYVVGINYSADKKNYPLLYPMRRIKLADYDLTEITRGANFPMAVIAVKREQ